MEYPLITKRLSIKPLEQADLENFVKYRQDPLIARYQSWSPDYSEAQAQSLIDSQAGQVLPKPGGWLQLGLHLSKTSELIGDLALHTVEADEACFEIGFTIDRRFQGNGYALEAANTLIDALVQNYAALRIIASADERNLSSLRLLSKLGFKHDPLRDWEEVFKGENVKVLFFEKLTALS